MPPTGRPAAPFAGGRADWLDVLKVLLVVGMICAHCIQLLMVRPTPAESVVSNFINIITFSGFMLAFGIGIGLSRRDKSWGQRLWPVLLLLLATWTSEFAFAVLVDRQAIGPELLLPLLTLRRLYGWSEFLASFTVLYLVIAVARPLLVAVAARWPLLVIAIVACLASTWIVLDTGLPLVPTIVGTTDFASFPLLPYLPWFLVGIAMARGVRLPPLLEWIAALLGTAAFAYSLWQDHDLPGRFPPTVLWIVGPALPLLVYITLALGIGRLKPPGWLLGTGRHVLAALLVSNLAIFTLRWRFGYRLGSPWWEPLVIAAAIVIGATIWANLLDMLRLRRGAAARTAAA